MKTIKLFLVLCLLSADSISFSQAQNYLPLQVGNKWFYHCTVYDSYSGNSSTDRVRVEITGTNIYNGKTYYTCTRTIFHINGTPNGNFSDGMFLFNNSVVNLRVDNTNGNIYLYSPSQYCSYSQYELMTDSLYAKLNDFVNVNCIAFPYTYKCTDTLLQKNFYYQYSSQPTYTRHRKYTKDIGLEFSSYMMSAGSGNYQTSQSLIGRVINGVSYGDTGYVFTGIAPVNSEVPDNFSLSQNYPNPFNPKTKISFDISTSSFTELKVFDLRGREVSNLVNENLTSGKYEIDFDASHLPSGIYYYRLVSGSFTQTKKMVLIK